MKVGGIHAVMQSIVFIEFLESKNVNLKDLQSSFNDSRSLLQPYRIVQSVTI